MPNSVNRSLRTAVAGVSGYAGGELARLLLRHPQLTSTPPIFLGRMGEPETHPACSNPASPRAFRSSLRGRIAGIGIRLETAGAGINRHPLSCDTSRAIPCLGTRCDRARNASHRPKWSMAPSLREISRGLQARRCRPGYGGQASNGSCVRISGASRTGHQTGAAGRKSWLLFDFDHSCVGASRARPI